MFRGQPRVKVHLKSTTQNDLEEHNPTGKVAIHLCASFLDRLLHSSNGGGRDIYKLCTLCVYINDLYVFIYECACVQRPIDVSFCLGSVTAPAIAIKKDPDTLIGGVKCFL